MIRIAHILVKEIHNNSNGVLEKGRVVLCLGKSISPSLTPIELTKDNLIFLIEDGDILRTLYKATASDWRVGEKIQVVNINGKKYLRTDSNNIAQDNLDNLLKY